MKSTGARFVSRLTNNTMALVLAGGRGQRLGVLTDQNKIDVCKTLDFCWAL